jgi:CRISPR type III-B/RAMP module RAMP protein Cmr6
MSLAINKDVAYWTQNLPFDNASLLYEKFLLPQDYGQGNKATQKETALQSLTQARLGITYQKRTKQLIELVEQSHGESARVHIATLESRLAINLGDGLLENAGIALDRTLGSPYIPASAVKGCCNHAAYWMVKKDQLDATLKDHIFGTGANEEDAHKGWITFLPAHPLDGVQIGLDILTPHQRPINGNEGNPIPNKYPVVEAGARFAFIYVLNTLGQRQSLEVQQACLSAMETILEQAFENGFGAKTAAGHGWFVRDTEFEAQRAAVAQAEREKREAAEKAAALQKAEAERIANEKAEQEANRLANEQKKAAEKAALAQKLEEASPDERLQFELENLSKDDFAKRLKTIASESTEHQHIIIKVFQAKNAKNQKKFLKDKKVSSILKTTAQELGIKL